MENDQQTYVTTRQFMDKLDEKYGHDSDKGQLFLRKTGELVNPNTLRVQIKGERCNIPPLRFAYWLKTGEVPENNIRAIDGNRANLRFDNLSIKRDLDERIRIHAKAMDEWSSKLWSFETKEEREAFRAANPAPEAPKIYD